MHRREFLRAVAAAPCVFGLRELFAQEPRAVPEWYRQALARMKDRKLHGIVLLAPDADPEQMKFGGRLWDLLDGNYPGVQELLLGGVLVVMTRPLAEAAGVVKEDDKETRFLLEPQGRRSASDTPPDKAFESAEGFIASFAPFLHGPGDLRLKSRADELASAAPTDVIDAFDALGADALEVRERATATLLARAGDLAPLYAWKRRTATDPEVASRLLSIAEVHFRSLAADRPGVRLPYGTRLPRFTESGCGRTELQEGEGPQAMIEACGRSRIDETKAQKFLRFLAK